MKIHSHTTALTAVLAVLLTSAAYADQRSGTKSGDAMGASETNPSPTAISAMSFESLDANKDGYISKFEAAKSQDLNQDWKQVDTNVDGKLDRSEFSAFETPSQGEMDTPSSSTGSTSDPGRQQPYRQNQNR